MALLFVMGFFDSRDHSEGFLYVFNVGEGFVGCGRRQVGGTRLGFGLWVLNFESYHQKTPIPRSKRPVCEYFRPLACSVLGSQGTNIFCVSVQPSENGRHLTSPKKELNPKA